MRAKSITIALVLASLLAGAGLAAEVKKDDDKNKGKDKDRVVLDWKRDPKVAPQPVEPSAPPAPDLPREMAPSSATVEPSRTAAPDVDAAAVRAADEMASEAMRTAGRREYWRAGFARGVTAALEDQRIAAADHAAGVTFGRSDPRAKPLGDRLAWEEAEGVADDAASERVQERFMDLSTDPRSNPTDIAMRREKRLGPQIPDFQGPYGVAPVLDDVFASHPPARAVGLSREGRRAIDEWRVEPATLAHADRQQRSYDAQWEDPQLAFARWKNRQRRGPAYSDSFRAAFSERYRSAIRSMDMRPLNEAWRAGFVDGWRYGAAIHSEWAYRKGYAEGFDAAVREAGTIEFPYAYQRAYDQSYAKWFDHWGRTAYPGLGKVRIADENDDGVFEPGERVLVDAEAVNYGGGFGEFDLIAAGKSFTESASATVRLVGRGRMPDTRKLSVQISPDIAARTDAKLSVSIGNERHEKTLWISRPLELQGAPAVVADRLEGRVTVSGSVQNNSRRDVPAVVRFDPTTATTESKREDLGVVPAGGSKRVVATFEGIHPLDLIGAESAWRVSIARGDQIDDKREVRLAPVATDLSSPDLMDFMIALARTPSVSRSDVHDSRELMMQRLRADWDRAVAADGNPYKRDYEGEGTETVLGQLVRIRKAGRSYSSPQVFDGMDRDVEALADDLPGSHPFLKKWMSKLAKQLK